MVAALLKLSKEPIMKKSVFLGLASSLMIASCVSANGNTPENEPLADYTCEFFSMKYPAGWEYTEEVNNMCDTIPAFFKGFRVMFYNPDPMAPFHVITVQKSTMFKLFETPEEWRDLSMELKEYDPQYLGYVEELVVDSLSFNNFPAAQAGFAVATETGDTIIHKQIVVMTDNGLYYLNNSFDWNDDGTLRENGDKILSTIQLQ